MTRCAVLSNSHRLAVKIIILRRRAYTNWDDVFNGIGDERKIQLLFATVPTARIEMLKTTYSHDLMLFNYTFNPSTVELGGLVYK